MFLNIADKPRKADRTGNHTMVKILSCAEGSNVDLVHMMGYRLTEVLLSIFNIGGQLTKAFKAKLIDYFLMDQKHLYNVA